MSNPLIRKLECFAPLSEEDRQSLARATGERLRRLAAHEEIVREGDRPREVHVMLAGWAFRYKQLEDGRRQILSFFLPGDICDAHVFHLKELDHSLATLTPATLASLSRDVFERLVGHHPAIASALQWDTLASAAIQREWTLNLGQRTALERIAHLLCEVFVRLRAVGLAFRSSCDFPVTQAELADATGLSTVHVNRTLQELRAAELVTLRERTLTILNFEMLCRTALFNPNYLHLAMAEAQTLPAVQSGMLLK